MARRSKLPPEPPVPGAVLVKAAASSFQPEVWRIGVGEDARGLKTYRSSRPWLRSTVCAWLARRECRNMAALEGVEGVPRLLGQPDPWSLEMTWLDAEELPGDRKRHDVTRAYFDELQSILEQLHARNMNHGDLRRKNLLRHTVTKRPLVIDFTQSIRSRSKRSLFHRLVVRRAIEVDRITFLKLKRWYLGDGALSEAEREMLARVPVHLRFGQFIRKKLYRPLKHWRQGKRRGRKSTR